jgi:excisionase family DNA binding protein
MDEEEYYTPEEIAARFKVTRQAVHKWIKDGKLQAVRLNTAVRIPKSALERFIHGGSAIQEKDVKQE